MGLRKSSMLEEADTAIRMSTTQTTDSGYSDYLANVYH